MKKASNILFIIGEVLHSFLLIVSPFLAIIGIYVLVNQEATYNELIKDSEMASIAIEDVQFVATSLLITGILTFVLLAVSLIVMIKAKKKIDEGNKNDTPYVLLLVFGLLSDNIFAVISGILELFIRADIKKAKMPEVLDGD